MKTKITKLCNVCNKKITEGYVILIPEYTTYCSEECLLKDGIDMDEFERINDNNEGDSYYYDWSKD